MMWQIVVLFPPSLVEWYLSTRNIANQTFHSFILCQDLSYYAENRQILLVMSLVTKELTRKGFSGNDNTAGPL